MLKVLHEQVVYSMSAEHPAAAYARSGDTLIIKTKDCYSNLLKSETDLAGSVPGECVNPATGPVYIENAEPGDMLKIEIMDIILPSEGVIALAPDMGVLGELLDTEETRIVKIQDGQVILNDKIRIPVQPMIGVIGTSPSIGEDIPTSTPGSHGGNLDCKEITIGTTLYLPVYVQGGLLALGDVHAVMADGEVGICGAECAAEVIIRVSVEKEWKLSFPFLINQTHYITISSAETLDEASKLAVYAMQEYLIKVCNIKLADAVMLLSLAADLKICQVVNPLKTCRMELPRKLIKDYL